MNIPQEEEQKTAQNDYSNLPPIKKTIIHYQPPEIQINKISPKTLKKTLANPKNPPKKPIKKSPCTNCRLISTIFIILTLLTLAILWNIFTKKILIFTINLVKKISSIKQPFCSLIFFLILVTLDFTFIPSQTTLGILITISMKNFLIPCLILTLSSTLSATITYILVKNCCRKKVTEKYKKSPLYKLVIQESKKSPLSTNFTIRLLYVPIGFKNYLLPLGDASYWAYLSCQLPFAIYFAVVITFIGLQLRDPMDLVDVRDFDQKTGGEKFHVIISWFFLILTLVILVVVCVWSRKKMKMLKKVDEEKVKEVEQGNKGNVSFNFKCVFLGF